MSLHIAISANMVYSISITHHIYHVPPLSRTISITSLGSKRRVKRRRMSPEGSQSVPEHPGGSRRLPERPKTSQSVPEASRRRPERPEASRRPPEGSQSVSERPGGHQQAARAPWHVASEVAWSDTHGDFLRFLNSLGTLRQRSRGAIPTAIFRNFWCVGGLHGRPPPSKGTLNPKSHWLG